MSSLSPVQAGIVFHRKSWLMWFLSLIFAYSHRLLLWIFYLIELSFQGHFYKWHTMGQLPISHQTGGPSFARTAQNCFANLRALSHEHGTLVCWGSAADRSSTPLKKFVFSGFWIQILSSLASGWERPLLGWRRLICGDQIKEVFGTGVEIQVRDYF